MSGPVMKPVGGFHDKTTLGAVYPTESIPRVINVDTRFRENPLTTNGSQCTIRLPRTYKNITSIRLSSVEMPNSWYDFSANLENTSVTICGTRCTIPDGNYTSTELTAAIQVATANVLTINAGFNNVTCKCTLTAATPFSIDFTPVYNNASACCIVRDATTRPFDTGLGYYLGFTNYTYSGSSNYVCEGITNLWGNTYVLLNIENYESVETPSLNGTSAPAFAKIPVNVPKYSIIYEGTDTIANKVVFSEPQNVSVFRIKLTDCWGRVLQTFGNFSFTIELEEVLSSKLYSAYKDNLVRPPFA